MLSDRLSRLISIDINLRYMFNTDEPLSPNYISLFNDFAFNSHGTPATKAPEEVLHALKVQYNWDLDRLMDVHPLTKLTVWEWVPARHYVIVQDDCRYTFYERLDQLPIGHVYGKEFDQQEPE